MGLSVTSIPYKTESGGTTKKNLSKIIRMFRATISELKTNEQKIAKINQIVAKVLAVTEKLTLLKRLGMTLA